jgi:PAS domain S-box-containing protein
VAVLYYVTARLSLRLALVGENVTPLWPPTGIALVAFLVLGRGIWPGVVLAAFLVNLPITTSPLAAATTAVGNTAAPLVAAELLRRVGFRTELDRLRDALAIVMLAALGSMTISATIGTLTLVLSGSIRSSGFLPAWAVWWTGDAMGVLVVAPFLLSLLHLGRRSHTTWLRRAEAIGWFVLLIVLSFAVTRTNLSMLFAVVPVLGLVAWRFRQRGAAPAALLVAGIATWSAAHGLGPFEGGTLFEKMLTLQAFNATVSFTSFVFAAIVTERSRAKRELEGAAAELEGRVQRRTSELSEANARLAEAQQVARIGSWEWLIPEDRVTWSDEMYHIYGLEPGTFELTFDKSVELIVPEDLPLLQHNVESALKGRRDHVLPAIEYRIRRPDGAERVLRGKARLSMSSEGSPARMIGTVQDVTGDKQAEREHRIAETLQRSLLPDRLPQIPGVALAARYVPAAGETEVGGDWYDVVPLPNGHLGVAIGDVAGHGLRAAVTMGQFRMAVRAYALEEDSPARVLSRVHQLVRRLSPSEMATLIYLVFDPASGGITFASAGHPPPLLIEPDGQNSYLHEGLAPPLGAAPRAGDYIQASSHLPAGSTLLLYTDGLVERRNVSIAQGLDRLREQAVGALELEALCDHLLTSLLGENVADDMALLALRPTAFAGQPLHVRLPAEPGALVPLRQTLRRWLREAGAPPDEIFAVVVACNEACANAVQHPYGAREGFLEIDVALIDGQVEITVSDSGRWRPPSPREGGLGLQIIQGLMGDVDVQTTEEGTTVRMRKHLGTVAVR